MNTTELIASTLQSQREFFATGATRSVSARILLLKKLYTSIQAHEADICAALEADLGKCRSEAYMTEIGTTLSEIQGLSRRVRKWAKPQRVSTNIANFPAVSYRIPEPYGAVLVISPWNYPFMLAMEPLAGAIAAGNTVMVKPSAYTPATSRMIRTIVEEVFPAEWAACIEGGRAENTALLEQRFDYIFFTGSPVTGREVMAKAAKHLTPVTLELGGKSPVIIDDSADLKLAAKRVMFGKLVNCGQTCIAPDYVLIDRRVEQKFARYCRDAIEELYGPDPINTPHYGCIVNEKHYKRLTALVDVEKVSYGGTCDELHLKLAPTIMRGVTAEDAVMQEEIFGPILPIIAVDSMAQAEEFIAAREKPLALYVFTKRKAVEERFLQYVSFGGGCVNDTIMHIFGDGLPFGGVGNSGMGSYHGKASFDTFTHYKSVLKKVTWFDLPLRYAPYSKGKDKLVHWFLG